eukprot:10841-Heterococcus_DN1.PRE.2
MLHVHVKRVMAKRRGSNGEQAKFRLCSHRRALFVIFLAFKTPLDLHLRCQRRAAVPTFDADDLESLQDRFGEVVWAKQNGAPNWPGAPTLSCLLMLC